MVVEQRGVVTVYEEGKEPFTPEIVAVNHMAAEIRFLANLILNPDAVNSKNPPESAAATVRLIERLRESARNGSEKITL